MKVGDLVKYAVEAKGSGLNPDEGVLFGDRDARVKAVLVTWMATVDALREAKRQRCNIVLCHEQFYIVPQGRDMQPQQMTWPTNRNRVRAAEAGGITVLRLHGTLDQICIWDDFVAALGIPNPAPGTGYEKVLTIPPTKVRTLAQKVKKALGLKHVRVAGDLDKTVRRVGFPWGGLGLDSNIGYQAARIMQGAQVLIAGECDEYGMTFPVDAGVPIIETGHAVSENIGLRHFTTRLKKAFPDVPFVFYPKTVAFRHV
ncbi:MAG: Nif3-like dinuclear metal center hexameric protein [Kiritimatiellae bacterium]|nr:Nif3-like dinuclear metal center hexameric protein [Kiritimatiellia bacterium]